MLLCHPSNEVFTEYNAAVIREEICQETKSIIMIGFRQLVNMDVREIRSENGGDCRVTNG